MPATAADPTSAEPGPTSWAGHDPTSPPHPSDVLVEVSASRSVVDVNEPTPEQRVFLRGEGLAPVGTVANGDCLFEAVRRSAAPWLDGYSVEDLRNHTADHLHENGATFLAGGADGDTYQREVEKIRTPGVYMLDMGDTALIALAWSRGLRVIVIDEHGMPMGGTDSQGQHGYGPDWGIRVTVLRRDIAGGHYLGTTRLLAGDSISPSELLAHELTSGEQDTTSATEFVPTNQKPDDQRVNPHGNALDEPSSPGAFPPPFPPDNALPPPPLPSPADMTIDVEPQTGHEPTGTGLSDSNIFEFGQPGTPQVGAVDLGVPGPQADIPADLAAWFQQTLDPEQARLFDTAWSDLVLTDPTWPDLPDWPNETDKGGNQR